MSEVVISLTIIMAFNKIYLIPWRRKHASHLQQSFSQYQKGVAFLAWRKKKQNKKQKTKTAKALDKAFSNPEKDRLVILSVAGHIGKRHQPGTIQGKPLHETATLPPAKCRIPKCPVLPQAAGPLCTLFPVPKHVEGKGHSGLTCEASCIST